MLGGEFEVRKWERERDSKYRIVFLSEKENNVYPARIIELNRLAKAQVQI